MIKKTKICLIIPSLKAGGMERVMSELANYFSQKENIEIHIVLLVKSNIFYSISDSIILHVPRFIFNPQKRLLNQIKTILYLRGKLRIIKPEVALSFGETYNSFVLLSSLFLKIKVFVSDRSRPNKRWGLLHENLRRILYPNAYGIISQTSYSKFFLLKETKHKNIKVIPNPIDHSKYAILPKENIILNVGRLISTKRIDRFLEIYSKIENKNYHLWIVGDGPLKNDLIQKSINLGLSEKVKFWGNQKNIEWFYSKAKIFAFTSISEGFPNALLEAISAGLPSISFDCIAGPSDIIENGVNGFLIPMGDETLFQQKLEELMTNEKLRNLMSSNAQSSSLKYEISKIGNDYLKFLLS